MSDSQITTDMEGIVSDPFFSETIEHQYPTDETENLTVQWFEPEAAGAEFASTLPSFQMKTSDNGNLDYKDSRFVRGSKTYKMNIPPFDDTGGITKIEVTEVDS